MSDTRSIVGFTQIVNKLKKLLRVSTPLKEYRFPSDHRDYVTIYMENEYFGFFRIEHLEGSRRYFVKCLDFEMSAYSPDMIYKTVETIKKYKEEKYGRI